MGASMTKSDVSELERLKLGRQASDVSTAPGSPSNASLQSECIQELESSFVSALGEAAFGMYGALEDDLLAFSSEGLLENRALKSVTQNFPSTDKQDPTAISCDNANKPSSSVRARIQCLPTEVHTVKPAAETSISAHHAASFDLLSDDLIGYALELEKDTSGFQQKINQTNFKLFIRKGSKLDAKHYLVKCQFELFDSTPSLVNDVLTRSEHRLQWDKSLMEYTILDTCEATRSDIYYMTYKSPCPFKNRDFVETRRIVTMDCGSTVIVSQAVKCKKAPVRSNFVRAETVLSAMICRPVYDENGVIVSTLCTNLAQINLQGALPASLVSVTLPSSYRKWYQTLQLTVTQTNSFT